MKSIAQFNALNGTTATRSQLTNILDLALAENQYHLANGIVTALDADGDTFTINLPEPVADITTNNGLNAPRHKGFGKVGLDCSGRLLPGFMFDNGNVVPIKKENLGLSAAEIKMFDFDDLNEENYTGLNGIPQQEIYDLVTNQLISNLENLKKWESGFSIDQNFHITAINFKTKKPYRGINQLLLGGNPMLGQNLDNPYYLTFNQVKDLGGTIKKGSKTKDAIFYTFLYNYEGFKTNERQIFVNHLRSLGKFSEKQISNLVYKNGYGILRIYNVFNGQDIEGIQWNLPKLNELPKLIVDKIDICEKIIDKYPSPAPKIYYKGNQPAYYPTLDKIEMPKAENWKDIRSFYAVLFHELIHSTGIQSRLNRGNDTRIRDKSPKDKQAYAFEELVAEIGASFVCANAGIFYYTKENAKTYIAGWRQNIVSYLKENNKGIFQASAKAQKAADFMLKNITDDDYISTIKQIVATKKPSKKPVKVTPKVTPKKYIAKEVVTLGKTKKNTKKSLFTFTNNGIFNLPVGLIFTDEKRFQNRTKLDQRIVNNIVKNFDATQFDPIVIWQDKNPKFGHTGQYFVLAGHHRFEAVKQLKHKTIQAKISEYTEKEAIEFAKEKSNANRTLELAQERAKIYRSKLQAGASKKEVLELAQENEGKNAPYILALAHLNPNGLTMQALNQLAESPDKQNATLIEKMAQWIGEARAQKPILDDANETEMFKFLQDKSQSERIKTKAEFLQKITAITGAFFEAGDVLNLARFKQKTEGENVYDAEMNNLKSKIEAAINNKQSLIDRIKNPTHPDFIKPTDKDYATVTKAMETAIAKYNEQIKFVQNKIIDLSRKKGSYTNAGSNQVGLFGGIEISTDDFIKMKPFELRNFTFKYYNENFKGKKVAIKNILHSVEFVGKVAKKLKYPMYSAKAAVVENLEEIIKNSTYNNFGKRKMTDSPDVLGYLNFNSKIYIDGIKKNVRISIILNFKKETQLKNVEISTKPKKSNVTNKAHRSITLSDIVTSLSENKSNKNNTKNKNSGLNLTINKNSLAYRNKKNENKVREFYKITNPEIANLLGKIEKKQKQSVAITVAGGQGSGKTTYVFQLINEFAKYYKVGHASIEEHPDSSIYENKAQRFWDKNAYATVDAPEIKSIQDVYDLVDRNEVIFIDSFSKLKAFDKSIELDKYFRQKYNGKLFVIIYQLTTVNMMRGGSTSQFDADIVQFVHKGKTFAENYVYNDKNRYNNKNFDDLHYKILAQRITNTASAPQLEHTTQTLKFVEL